MNGSDNTTGRVLVVDDEPCIREVIGECLKLEGYLVDEASSAAEAVRLFMRHNYDLLTLDLHMPGLDGSQLHQILTEEFDYKCVSVNVRRRLPPILIITGSADNPQVLQWLGRKQIAGVLQKPIRPSRLLNAVQEILSIRPKRRNGLQSTLN